MGKCIRQEDRASVLTMVVRIFLDLAEGLTFELGLQYG